MPRSPGISTGNTSEAGGCLRRMEAAGPRAQLVPGALMPALPSEQGLLTPRPGAP